MIDRLTEKIQNTNKIVTQRLKYVQRTGQGVDIIFREMISSGKTYPQYHA